MENIHFITKYALIKYKVAKLENYDHEIVATSDDLEELENIDTEGYGISVAFTVYEKLENGNIIDYYSGE